jgi:hypothetical protein
LIVNADYSNFTFGVIVKLFWGIVGTGIVFADLRKDCDLCVQSVLEIQAVFWSTSPAFVFITGWQNGAEWNN